ncbi:MAG TPA: aldehyde dehydrogenase family protein, partial [Caballeronia sp.]|nr:aldehyde dehydrogenase family protein [Caballeronia sp.]
ALRLGELALAAGVPPGVVNVVTGRGSSAGQALASHPLVSKVTFTGSTAVGKTVGHAAVDNMTRFTLELGGKNPMIVLADADVDNTIQGVLMAGLLNQGQVCAAASRLYIHRDRFRQIVEGVAAAANSMSIGPGMDPTAQINPLISARQQQSVCRFIDIGRAEGATVLAGGGAPDLPGYFVKPTVLIDVDHASTVVREEIFGPVLVAIPFDHTDDAIRLANDSPYGLAASLWSNDLGAVMNLVPQIQAGTVWINSHVPLDPNLPFGGHKQSGVGREFGRQAVESCTEVKSVCIAH